MTEKPQADFFETLPTFEEFSGVADAKRQAGLQIVQAWTRDDDWVQAWYESCGFR